METTCQNVSCVTLLSFSESGLAYIQHFLLIFPVGPAVEAFGFQRIIFGSSPSSVTKIESKAGYWYEIARESLAELGVEQEDIDAVFSDNAKEVYGS